MGDGPKYILALDTATPCSTVALVSGTRTEGRVLASYGVSSSVTHSRRLLVAVDRLLSDGGLAREDIEGFAVGLGPGSFTGLRIGMATVKGLAAAAGKPLYGVSTLDVIAAGCTDDNRLLCSVLDARKKEVYAAFYRTDGSGIPRRVSEIAVLSPDKLGRLITEPVMMVGDGLIAYKSLWQDQLGTLVRFAPVQHWNPSAATLGLLAGELLEQNKPLDTASAAPLYVRASDAELNLKMPAAE